MATRISDADHGYVLSDAEHKKRIREILTKRGLASFMNDTKWRELCRSIDELPFPPAYQIKRVDAEEPAPSELPYAPTYFGDWGKTPEASLGLNIEWLKIAPRHSQHRGNLISPTIQDCSRELHGILERLNMTYIEEDGFIVLYGHGSALNLD